MPVAPADAGTGFDRQALEIERELVAFGEPHVSLVGEGAVIGERLVNKVGAVLVVGADRVRVPQIPIDPSSLPAAPGQDHRTVAGDLREIRAGDLPWQEGTRAGEDAGLDQLAPADIKKWG